MIPYLPRPAIAVATIALAVMLTACSGISPGGGLDGCLDSDRGTIAVGVTNTGDEPLRVSGVAVTEGSGVEVVDQFVALSEQARDTAVLFSTGGRDEFGGIALDRATIEPGASAYIGIEVERTGSGEGNVNGLTVTADGTDRGVPVSLVLRDSCE